MKNLSFRIPEELAEHVADRTRRWRRTDSEVYRQIIEEWSRLQDHPRIRFIDGPAGRRAALVGGPDVWEIIDTARAFEFDRAAMLEAYAWLSADQLEAATSYYDSFPDEIDALIADNRDIAEQLAEELDLVVREGASSDARPRGGPPDA